MDEDEELNASTPSVEEWQEFDAIDAIFGGSLPGGAGPLTLAPVPAPTPSRTLPAEGIVLTFRKEDLFGARPETEAERAKRLEVEREIRREQRRVQTGLHKIHLLCLTAALVFRSKVCNEPVLQAIALSCAPPSIASSKQPDKKTLQRLAQWFSTTFSVDAQQPAIEEMAPPRRQGSKADPVELDSDPEVEERECGGAHESAHAAAASLASSSRLKDKTQLKALLVCAQTMTGPAEDGAALFTALVRALGFTARLATSLQPEPSIRAINRIGTEASAAVPRKKAKAAPTGPTSSSAEVLASTPAAGSGSGGVRTAARTASQSSRSSAPTSSPQQGGGRSSGSVMVLSDNDDEEGGPTASLPMQKVCAWTEVYMEAQKRWVYVNGLTGTVDRPSEVEELCGCPVHYVLGAHKAGFVSDVTERYAHKWVSATFKYRVKDKWWRKSLAPLQDPNEAAAREEKADLEEAQLSVSLPTAFAAYKSHKLYALERFLLKLEIIHPRGPILGYCKGEPVFRRDCVQTLKSKGAWIKEGRSIKAGETCAKLVKGRAPSKERAKGRGKESALRRKSSASSTGSKSASGRKRPQAREDEFEVEDEEGEQGEEDEDGSANQDGGGLDADLLMEEELANAGDGASVELFGHWQTEPYKRPVASGGVVPVNSFGNVDLYKPEMLPINTVHLTEPGMAAVARELNIHCADAVVGFDFAAGRSFPVKDGIIVCAEFAQLLREVWTQKQQVMVDKAADDRTARVLQRWSRLVSQYLLHQQLKARYFSKT